MGALAFIRNIEKRGAGLALSLFAGDAVRGGGGEGGRGSLPAAKAHLPFRNRNHRRRQRATRRLQCRAERCELTPSESGRATSARHKRQDERSEAAAGLPSAVCPRIRPGRTNLVSPSVRPTARLSFDRRHRPTSAGQRWRQVLFVSPG